jgi:hypothetical protein
VTRPPSGGAVHFTRTVLAAVTDTVGVPGTPGAAGMIAADRTDGALPAGPFAVTKNVYDVPAVRPEKAQLSVLVGVRVQAPGGVTTGSDVTE